MPSNLEKIRCYKLVKQFKFDKGFPTSLPTPLRISVVIIGESERHYVIQKSDLKRAVQICLGFEIV